MAVDGGTTSCFISYVRSDRAWAEWTAWQLKDAGYEVWLDAWQLRAGSSWPSGIAAAVRDAAKVLVLVSVRYADSRFTRAELTAARDAEATIVPVVLDDTRLPRSLEGLQAVRLKGLGEQAARDTLLRAVRPDKVPAGGVLRRLGAVSPRLPGTRPRVWNVPELCDPFVGRDDLLYKIRSALAERSRVILTGKSGMGKTQLAVEYAQRFAGEYELVWWVRPTRLQVAPQLAELARHTGAAAPDSPPSEAVAALTDELRGRGRWLLVLDDSSSPTDVPKDLLRSTESGHILVTSRDSAWRQWGKRIDVGPLRPAESSELLRRYACSLPRSEARALAADLGHMPLAIIQAAKLIEQGVPISGYRRALNAEEGAHGPHHRLEDTVRIAQDRLASDHPGAASLLASCALLAPDPFPLHACRGVPEWTPSDVAALLAEPEAMDQALSAIGRYGLARVDGTLRLHPGTLPALRDRLSEGERAEAALGAQALLVSALSTRPASSEYWAVLLPHLLAIAPRDLTRLEGFEAARRACAHLLEAGDSATAVTRLSALLEVADERFGPDAEPTMETMSSLAQGVRAAGDFGASRSLTKRILTWSRRVFGENHLTTLETAARLAMLLAESGEAHGAHDLGTETRQKLQQVLGADHPTTLALSAGLITVVRQLGLVDEARYLAEDTLDRQRRILGPQHPDALRTAVRLAGLLADAGEPERATALGEDTFLRLRRSLGPDHPSVLQAGAMLGALLSRRGDHVRAHELLSATLERQRRTLGADHPDALATSAQLITVLALMKRLAEARRDAGRLVARQEHTLGPGHPRTLRCSALLAALCWAMRDYDTALARSRRVRDRQLAALGHGHRDTVDTTALLATCLADSGRHAEAERELRCLPTDAREAAISADVLPRFLNDLPVSPDAGVPERLPGEVSQARTESPTRPVTASSGRLRVLVSHAEADRHWADWVRFELAARGHEVLAGRARTLVGHHVNQECDVVLALFSDAYLDSPAAAPVVSALAGDPPGPEAADGRRYVSLFVSHVDRARLPPVLWELITPALSDLDSDAARELLGFTLTGAGGADRGPSFPGVTGPEDSGQAVLIRRLVTALERSLALQTRENRRDLLTRLHPHGTHRLSQEGVSLRTTLYEAVRAARSMPGGRGLSLLVDTVEMMDDPGSFAVAEARRITAEIESSRETR
ncbi:FxSxx-COOH system tetratricopeptide repeat protein [Streptomyces sp. NPDC059906]|uniref:FxSxx-COOH system tetratricopeptide repeat protein n=1 Tax=Streptomyces sp. NPDC059906 TaxID=3346997 RepID=UPI003654B7A1